MRDRQPNRGHDGFTLIELMITIVIIGILAGIALPAYQNSVRKSHRSAAQAEMLDIANREQQVFLANRSYTATLSNLGYSVPTEVAARYTCTVSVTSTGLPTFTVSCAPTSLQSASGFGTLTLDSTGAKTPASEW
jgi:type IV pilus assembly protein PilE